jgi:hypothetical protein
MLFLFGDFDDAERWIRRATDPVFTNAFDWKRWERASRRERRKSERWKKRDE